MAESLIRHCLCGPTFLGSWAPLTSRSLVAAKSERYGWRSGQYKSIVVNSKGENDTSRNLSKNVKRSDLGKIAPIVNTSSPPICIS